MNATCERLVGTLRRELLDRVLILGQAHVRAVLAEYQGHYKHGLAAPRYRAARPRRRRQRSPCLGNRPNAERIHRKPVLNGLINEYTRAA